MFNRRADGRRLKTISPFLMITPFIMERRTSSSNTLTIKVGLDGMRTFIQSCRERGIAMSYMIILIAAYVRTVAEHPVLNRFVVNKRIYARNSLSVSFVILREYEEQDASETTVKIAFDRRDDIYTIAEKIAKIVGENRSAEVDNNVDRLVGSIMSLPLIPLMIVGLLKWMERHGLLPKSIMDTSPFHTSLFITNMASLRMPSLHHHLYDFGTTTVFIAMGAPEGVFENGEKRQVLPLGIVTDERICAGAAYARCFKTLLRYMANPTLLEQPAEIVKEDVR